MKRLWGLRSPTAVPSLPDFNFRTLFGGLRDSFTHASRLRSLLNYFDILHAEEPWGHVAFARHAAPPTRPTQRAAATPQENKGQTIVGLLESKQAECDGDGRGLLSKPLVPIFVLQVHIQSTSDIGVITPQNL